MKYISTRGKVAPIGFIDMFLMGLGEDGGLIVPETIPTVTAGQLKAWSKLSYQDLMLEVFSLFTNDEIPEQDLRTLIQDSYAGFTSPAVLPLTTLNDSLHVLELFHGPTFAFKDVALQFMGNLYAYVAKKQNKVINILGATSGDTGASAISSVSGKEGIQICILHPNGKVSRVQELQMTTVQDDNVLNLAVNGNFDDCQQIIKELFADISFKTKYHLRAINSINFVRILAQSVYYFYAYLQLPEKTRADGVNFSIPTGNFGNIFSGYLAKKMGVPIKQLVLATNENNILERFIREGVYKPEGFRMTHSPSMDIQIASNFERYLYYFLGENAGEVSARMEKFKAEGQLTFTAEEVARIQQDMTAYSVGNAECLDTIQAYQERYGYLLDPHSACGIAAYESAGNKGDGAFVSLATAHPAKFDEAIRLIGIEQTFPERIQALFDKPQRQVVVDNAKAEIAAQLEGFYRI
ncbi:threonine synthase [Cohnella cholangitidis]|uniref:Threonine synthase n=1 Tax=Cohnella cholangitidis TaxID=2598458 RepID=A0A7G5BWY2_9BACL|nr:threonine synthase [Cohnella cholangitidis]QMV41466.1 threonine synthase [Cohnella cholangitidis]